MTNFGDIVQVRRSTLLADVHRGASIQASVRVRTGAAHSDGDTMTDDNGETWTYETGTELPWGRIRAHTDGYGGFTTGWYSRDFDGDSGVDGFIVSYAATQRAASKVAKSTTSSSSSSSSSKSPSGSGSSTYAPPVTYTPGAEASSASGGSFTTLYIAGAFFIVAVALVLIL